MPSLILSGHPCIGKTTFATLLASRALSHSSSTITNIIHIRENTACPDQTKSQCYSNSHAEKTTRAALKSEFDKGVISGGQNTLIILDSLNYIKGYRYELYCISKAAGERHGVVWIQGTNANDGLAKKRNGERKEMFLKGKADIDGQSEQINHSDGYYEDDEMMDALVLRYEPPDGKNRWENPLYKVDVTSILPWDKNGTLENAKVESDLTNQMKNVEVKDNEQGATATQSTEISTKPVKKKSASGFKRRAKKSTTTTQQTAPAPTPATTQQVPPTTATPKAPISMASRNLNTNPDTTQPQSNTNGNTQTIEQVIDSILESFLTNTAPLKEGMSTAAHHSSDSNVLNQVDNLTQRINAEVLKAQINLTSGIGGRIFIPLSISGKSSTSSEGRRAMNLSKPLYQNELRNCRRQFLKWIAGHPMPEGTSEERMVEVYVSYIESNV